MRAVVQRVKNASVTVDGNITGEIGHGLLILFGAEEGDGQEDMDYVVKKCVDLRIFCDEQDKMNLSVKDIDGGILAVSQFTLLGDARGGRRPSFITAARPETANPMYERLVAAWREQGIHVETGRFGGDMQVESVNDGPVTIILDTQEL